MNIRNCTRCGKIYNYDGFKVCQNCRKEDEVDFKKVKEYLRENPGANISQVHEDTEVENSKIIDFLRDGRLEVEEGGNLLIECESCGIGIRTGRFCEECASTLSREMGRVVDSGRSKNPTSSKRDEKFRVADRYEKRR